MRVQQDVYGSGLQSSGMSTIVVDMGDCVGGLCMRSGLRG